MVSDPDSESQLALYAKRWKLKLVISTVCLKKCDFLQTTLNIDILYTVGKYLFGMSKDSRSLPQNKALVGSDQLSKFCQFAHKSIPMIQALSSRTKVTIIMRMSRGTC